MWRVTACVASRTGHLLPVRSFVCARPAVAIAGPRSAGVCIPPRCAPSLVPRICRSLSTAPPADKAADKPTAKPDEAADQQQQEEAGQQQAQEEPVFEEPVSDEPFVARLSRFVWTSIKFLLGMSIVTVVVYAGYTIVITLLPSGASANAIMRRAGDVIKHDPELATYFGDIKIYGEDFGGSREGRRYFVQEYSYADPVSDVPYHRVRFNLEGDRGRKATVWAEVREGTYEFRYIIALAKDRSRVWSVVDHRRPEPSVDEQQAAVTTLLQEAGWTFYADNELESREQGGALGDYWLKVRSVRCDLDAARCAADGVASRPAWTTGPAPAPGILATATAAVLEWTGQAKPASAADAATAPVAVAVTASGARLRVAAGTKTLRELEALTKELRKAKEGAAGGEAASLFARFKRVLGL